MTTYIANLIDTIRLPFRQERELYRSFYDMLGFYPRNIELYKQALVHKSLSFRNNQGRPLNNERLEFLGDAILDAVVGDIVYQHFQKKREGFLTNTRSKIVQRETLGKLAVEIGLDKLIQSSDNCSQSHNSYMAGNAFEAMVGAIYLDRGYDFCMRFMEKRILNQLLNIDTVANHEVNFKSKILEWSQKNRINLEFKLLEESRDEKGAPVFLSQIVIEDVVCATGKGYSKKESQQIACRETLKQLKKNKRLEESIFLNKEKRTAMEAMPVMAVPNIEIGG